MQTISLIFALRSKADQLVVQSCMRAEEETLCCHFGSLNESFQSESFHYMLYILKWLVFTVCFILLHFLAVRSYKLLSFKLTVHLCADMSRQFDSLLDAPTRSAWKQKLTKYSAPVSSWMTGHAAVDKANENVEADLIVIISSHKPLLHRKILK